MIKNVLIMFNFNNYYQQDLRSFGLDGPSRLYSKFEVPYFFNFSDYPI
jgi:hypothetical protein